MEGSRKSSLLKDFWFVPVSLVLILLIFFSGFRICITVGESMSPTLINSEMLWMKTKNYRINRYDIIVFSKKGQKNLIKRVIGLPGEEIQIIDNDIYINGQKTEDKVDIEMEDYGVLKDGIKLKDNEYFAMGDNRNNSFDCRKLGPVTTDDIIGKILYRFPSFEKLCESEDE